MSDTRNYGLAQDPVIEDPAVVAINVGKKYPLKDASKRGKGLRGRFSQKYVDALRGVSFVARQGESIGIIGRNGSGKSTLLRIVAGGEAPTSGSVLVSHQPSLLGVSPALQSWLTGEQNIYLGLLALGMQPEEARASIPEIVEWAELGEAANRPMSTYSSGMGAKLSFAISTAVRPEILLVDETLSTGDAAFGSKAKARMDGLLESAGNIFLVSHSLPTIKANCTRAIWIHQGDQILDGPVDDVTAAYAEFSEILKRDDSVGATKFLGECRHPAPSMDLQRG